MYINIYTYMNKDYTYIFVFQESMWFWNPTDSSQEGLKGHSG